MLQLCLDIVPYDCVREAQCRRCSVRIALSGGRDCKSGGAGEKKRANLPTLPDAAHGSGLHKSNLKQYI
jgi:hypothetical protein